MADYLWRGEVPELTALERGGTVTATVRKNGITYDVDDGMVVQHIGEEVAWNDAVAAHLAGKLRSVADALFAAHHVATS